MLLPVPNAGADISICSGDITIITATGGISYLWTPGGETTASITVSPVNITIYTVSVTADSNGCSSSSPDSVTVIVYPRPTANAGTDTTIVSGASVVIGGTPTGSGSLPPYTYSWSSPNDMNFSSLDNPTVSPVVDITYTVIVTDDNGCQDSSSIRIVVKDTIFIPTAFTPNGDGQNDTLYVRGFGISKIDFKIYNRWGELVFESKDKSKGWGGDFKGNGIIQEMDVYIYYLEAEFTNSESIKLRERITLLK